MGELLRAVGQPRLGGRHAEERAHRGTVLAGAGGELLQAVDLSGEFRERVGASEVGVLDLVVQLQTDGDDGGVGGGIVGGGGAWYVLAVSCGNDVPYGPRG